MLDVTLPDAIACPGCGTEVPSRFLVCPRCQRLVHADALKGLASRAEAAEQGGDLADALAAWRSALELLPPGSKQQTAIAARIGELGRKVGKSPTPTAPGSPSHSGWGGGARAGAAGVGALGLALWKFKFVALLLLGKGKLLLLGLTKASTLFSMLLALGVYWSIWGWPFALGFVLMIYIHEMGHVAALSRYGIKADAPMFIPGLGALVRLRQALVNPHEDAAVGLAGPIWGLGSVLACGAAYLATGWAILAAIAQTAAAINLFNLLPIGSLDGGRAFRALSRSQRWLATLTCSAMWAATESEIAAILMVVGAYRALVGKPADEPDTTATASYVGLVVALAFLSKIPVPMP